MLMDKTAGAVERERERERATFLTKRNVVLFDILTHTQVVLNNIFLEINYRNKDPCYGLRLLYLRI